jgi:hypothetical protein
MGTGHSIDTPIRVAPFGISSVISLVDDLLLERIRRHYITEYKLPDLPIPWNVEDGRARRVTAYMETVQKVVLIKLEAIKNLPFFANNDKKKYFDLLPDTAPLKQAYQRMLAMAAGPERTALEHDLTEQMTPGSIGVNIMVKLDKMNYAASGVIMSEEFSDAKSALRGYANSSLSSSIIFSAGINQSLFSYMTRFRDFYRDAAGEVKKKIILKVSDFRSALIQGKFMAKKGLEVHEFRIESGLNCGGHAFASNGELLPTLLQEFKEKRDQLVAEFQPMIQRFYEEMGWEFPEAAKNHHPLITVQGGIGTHGEVRRLQEDFGMDLTGWASPFLLVPEATCVDNPTRELLRQAKEEDLYLSDVSPLGVPFNNVRNSGSERWTRTRIAAGTPGSPCPKKFLVSNTEFTERPICHASAEFQQHKLAEIDAADMPESEKLYRKRMVMEKTCICDHLGNGALIALGLEEERNSPQSICPGPNIAWFDRIYTLQEMVDHIYGRGATLVPAERPHMFAKEIVMYVDYFEKLVERCAYTPREVKTLREFAKNMEEGMEFCLKIAERKPYPDENLESIPPCVGRERERMRAMVARFEGHLERTAAAVTA